MTVRPPPGPPDLAAAVSALCDRVRVQVERDPVAVKAVHAAAVRVARKSGTTTRDIDQVLGAFRELKRAASRWADRPSLLSQLREATGHGGGIQTDRPGGSVRIPVNPDAIDLLAAVRDGVRDALDSLGLTARHVDGSPVDPVHGDLRRLVVAAWPPAPPDQPASRDVFTARVIRWSDRTRALLDPEPEAAERSARDTPCVSCAALYVTERRDGDLERAPALRVDLVSGLVRGIACRGCGHYVWRETDEAGEPAGAFAELRDHAQAHHAALAEWSADLRDADRQAREARELGARWGVPYLDQVTGCDTQTVTLGDGADAAEVTYVTWTYTDGSDWRVRTNRRPLTPRRSA